MARRGTALVPTRVQIDNFPAYADAGQAPSSRGYAAHMRDLHARADTVLRAAYEAGVPIFAGTDAGGVLPHGLIGREVAALHEAVGLSPYDALGAASWRAREWLGFPGPVAGASADFVLYDEDPLADLRILAHPCPARVACRAPRGPALHAGAGADWVGAHRSGTMARCTRCTADPLIRCVPRPPAGTDHTPTWTGAATRMREAGASSTVAVKIKLMRLGKIRAPYYRIVVADSRTKRDGRAIETIGKYHPTQEPSLIEVDSERAQYWLGVGAQPTEPVAAILKVTGDWQKFKGLPGAEGTLRVAEPKVSKKTTFEAAAKDSAGEAKDGATTPKKRAAKKAAATAAEGTPAAAEPPPTRLPPRATCARPARRRQDPAADGRRCPAAEETTPAPEAETAEAEAGPAADAAATPTAADAAKDEG